MLKEKWTEGKTGECVVSDTPNLHSSDDNVDYYGGYLVAESIPKRKYINLIIAAPDMYTKLDDLRIMLEEAVVHSDLADVDILIFKQTIRDIKSLLAKACKESEGQDD